MGARMEERWLERHMGLGWGWWLWLSLPRPPLLWGGPRRVNRGLVTVVGAPHRVTVPPTTPCRGDMVGAQRMSLCVGQCPSPSATSLGQGGDADPAGCWGAGGTPRGGREPPEARRGKQAAFPPAARAGVRGKELDKA